MHSCLNSTHSTGLERTMHLKTLLIFNCLLLLLVFVIRYADRAKQIVCKAIVNEDPNAKVLASIIVKLLVRILHILHIQQQHLFKKGKKLI